MDCSGGKAEEVSDVIVKEVVLVWVFLEGLLVGVVFLLMEGLWGGLGWLLLLLPLLLRSSLLSSSPGGSLVGYPLASTCW